MYSGIHWVFKNMLRKTSNESVLSKPAKLSSLLEINQSSSWWIRLKSEGPLKQKLHFPAVFSNPPVAVVKVKKLRSVVNNGGAIPPH